MTREAIETALNTGQVWAAMRNGRFWRVRRNGATKLWKTRPDEWAIPVKAGLRSCAYLTHTSSIELVNAEGWRSANFVISADDPN